MLQQHILNKTVHLFLQTLDLNNKDVLISFSAGADSTALLHVLNEKAQIFNFKLSAVFFIHKDSPLNEGEDNALMVARNICFKFGVPLIEHNLFLSKLAGKSWEECGRNGRNNFFTHSDFDFIFLGHHLDDQNENTIMELFRGGGHGTSGMQYISGKKCRPLLNISKNHIYDYLIKNNLVWFEDPTNNNTSIKRNLLRKKFFPVLSDIYPNYTKLLSLFRKKQQFQFELSLELAKIDGLEALLNNECVAFKAIKNNRLINLIQHYGRIKGANLESNKIEDYLKKLSLIKFIQIDTEKYILFFQKTDNDLFIKNIKAEQHKTFRLP